MFCKFALSIYVFIANISWVMGQRYLFGSAVQGIQQYIFQTNRLTDIIGASQLVENICTELFREVMGDDYEKDNVVIQAAGNVKYVMPSRQVCERVVREWPRKVQEYVPGVTVSQAVVELSDANDFAKAVNELEQRLRVQRNRAIATSPLALMGMLRSRQTGLPCVAYDKFDREKAPIDQVTEAKRKCADEEGKLSLRTTLLGKERAGKVVKTLEDMADANSWIAVIHADGNGLGQVVSRIGSDREEFRNFSQRLNEATIRAAQRAAQEVLASNEDVVPMQPIVLGGDDLTLVCRADLALPFVQAFLREFEQESHDRLGTLLVDKGIFTEGEVRDRLTACAGVAYVKRKYPFYSAYELAETLCAQAKKDAKSPKGVQEGRALPQSCVMMHKVQDSWKQGWQDIAARELQPQPSISLAAGPYYLVEPHADLQQDQRPRYTIDWLMNAARTLHSQEGSAVKSDLRQWLTLLHDNPEAAQQLRDRLQDITHDSHLKKLIDQLAPPQKGADSDVFYSAALDVLAQHTLSSFT